MQRSIFVFLLGGAALLAWRYMKPWEPPKAAEPYMPTIRAAAGMHGVPVLLLARLLHQESAYRPDIISGDTRSSAGAVGIAQIVPRWHPNVDPTDPIESIYYAANYLASLKAQFGSWPLALAAYNYGPGNMNELIGSRGASWWMFAPEETRAYVADIMSDASPESSV